MVGLVICGRNSNKSINRDVMRTAMVLSILSSFVTASSLPSHSSPKRAASEPDLPKVLVFGPPGSWKTIGEESFFSKKFRYLKAYESSLPLDQFLATHARSVQAALADSRSRITPHILDLLPALRVVVTTSAGLNHVDIPECRRRGVKIANTGNVFSDDVADLAVGLFIDMLRSISAADRYVRKELWAINGDYPLGSKLRGKKVGIVGLGNIGYEVARRLESFGCCVSYTSRNKKPYASYPFYKNVLDLAVNCDALIICCALTAGTHHMINKRVLSALGKGGVVVNIARGPIIDEKEMVKFLVDGQIAGAGLDVFENEPHVPKELCELDNVVLSSHIAVSSPEPLKGLSELVVGNFEAFFASKPLLSEYLDD